MALHKMDEVSGDLQELAESDDKIKTGTTTMNHRMKSPSKTTTPTPLIQVPIVVPRSFDIYFLVETNIICTYTTHVILRIQSAAKNYKERMMIRRTWGCFNTRQTYAGQLLAREVKIGYIVGHSPTQSINQEVQRESQMFHDMIIANFRDSYRNRTFKAF